MDKIIWRFPRIPLLLLVLFCELAGVADESEFRLESIGPLYGFGTGTTSSPFEEAALAVDWDLPWHWHKGTNWLLKTQLDVTAGWLQGSGENAFIGSVGPTLVLSRGSFPISIVVGFVPTYISKWEFETKDLGIPFQVTTRLGLNWDVRRHLRLLFRFQHMSNLGIEPPNPGLNLQMFGVSYRF